MFFWLDSFFVVCFVILSGFFFFSSRRRHTRWNCDWSSDVCSSDLMQEALGGADRIAAIRDLEQQVRAESWNGNTGQSIGEVRKRTRWIRPNLLRVDQIGRASCRERV